MMSEFSTSKGKIRAFAILLSIPMFLVAAYTLYIMIVIKLLYLLEDPF